MKADRGESLPKGNIITLEILLIAAAFMHLTFLGTFAVFGQMIVVVFNIFSVIFYVMGVVDCLLGRTLRHKYFWINAAFAELVIHSVVCTILEGFDTYFILYLIATIPIAGYLLFFYFDKDSFRKIAVFYSIIIIVMTVFTLTFIRVLGPVYQMEGFQELTEAQTAFVRNINIAFIIVTLFAFTYLFFYEINTLIAKLNESNRKYEYIATHDALTGLSNRYKLWDFVDDLMKNDGHFCFIMGDLDDFKKINDTFGHDCGDNVLKAVSAIIRDQTKEGEMSCRWGGEEMLLIMRGGKDECLLRVNEIKRRINELDIVSGGKPVRVSMTFGFADCSEIEEEMPRETEPVLKNSHYRMDKMIAIADRKLYVGKRSGKNVVID